MWDRNTSGRGTVRTKKPGATRRRACAIGMACAIGLLGASLVACGSDGNNAAGNVRTHDWSDAIAAKVDGEKITEADVNDYIDGYRKAYGLVTDAKWATFLDEQSSTVSAYREAAIRQIAERRVVGRIADEAGIDVTDKEVDAAIADARKQAGYADDSDGWNAFLSSIGKDAKSYRADVRLTLLVRRYAETHADIKTPSESQMRSYASTDVAKYTGKRVVAVSFTRSADAMAARAELGDSGITMDAINAVADKHDGKAKNLGWNGLSDMDGACTKAISDLSAGQASDVTHDGGKYVIYYVSQEYDASTDGSVDVGTMPKELYNALKSDVTTSINANAMQECLDALMKRHNLSINDMPKGLPYDIDIKTNSTYGATNSNADSGSENADANVADANNGSAKE